MENKIENPKSSIFKKKWVQSLTGAIIVLLLAGGAVLYKAVSSRISTDAALISAPIISISPESPGVLNELYVQVGDTVTAGEALARVGGQVLGAQVDGLVIEADNTPGSMFQPGQAVVQMIQPSELRVVATVKENEGLSSIKAGDPVYFTVDAFPGKKYVGVVESISPNSKESGVVFNISDKREVKQFEVKIKFDVAAHPEFKDGMSAKVKIFKSVK
jgi:multidrug resistance efflux pump